MKELNLLQTVMVDKFVSLLGASVTCVTRIENTNGHCVVTLRTKLDCIQMRIDRDGQIMRIKAQALTELMDAAALQ